MTSYPIYGSIDGMIKYKLAPGATKAEGFGCLLVILVLNFFLGGLALNYTLSTFFGHTIQFLLAGLIGLFLGEILFVTAIISWVFHLMGTSLPVFH